MATSLNYRTALAAALLDFLDFVEGKLREALDDPASQLAAASTWRANDRVSLNQSACSL